jgi:hypothetical protein
MLPCFLALACEWRDAADRLRSHGLPEGHPLLGVWREAAWCHVLFARGLHAAAAARLRVVVRDVTGVFPPAGEGVADMFSRLRGVASARHPEVFVLPTAA